MSLKGDFESFFMNSIFQLLNDEQKTGILRVIEGAKEIRIYFLDGNIVYAMGSKKQDRLGAFIKKQGIISNDQLKACLAKGKQEKKALGKILVEQGYISEEKLNEIIHQQTQEMVFNLFLWEKGSFEYQDVKLNVNSIVVTKLNVMATLLEASRRIDEMSVFKKQIPSDTLVFRLSGNVQNKDEIKLNSDEWLFLGLFDGKQKVREVIDASDFDEFSAYKIIHSLLSSGLIEKSRDDSQQASKAAEPEAQSDYSFIITVYNDLFQILWRILGSELGKQMHTLFNESRPILDSDPGDVFKDFHPNNPLSTNISNISRAMSQIEDYEKGRTILVENFNEFILNIIQAIPEILGPNFALELVREAEESLPQINSYQDGSDEKSRIIDDIQHALILAEVRIEEGR
jgi:hypothetical protein